MKKEVVLAIDIGGTTTEYAWIDKKGNFLSVGKLNTKDYNNENIFFDALIDSSLLAVENLSYDVTHVATGIGAPNGNYLTGMIEFIPNLKWNENISVTEYFTKKMKVPAFLTNDAKAAALGEMLYGNARGMRNFVVITLGTGLGCGIVVNGDLLYGHDGLAGELGHTSMKKDDRFCSCGLKGCVETYVSARGICQTYMELHQNESYENITTKDIADKALTGDLSAIKAFDITSEILGEKLADLVAIVRPEAIFIFGGIAKAGDLILVPLRKYFEMNLLKIYKNKIKILPSAFQGAESAVLGASALAWNEIRKV